MAKLTAWARVQLLCSYYADCSHALLAAEPIMSSCCLSEGWHVVQVWMPFLCVNVVVLMLVWTQSCVFLAGSSVCMFVDVTGRSVGATQVGKLHASGYIFRQLTTCCTADS